MSTKEKEIKDQGKDVQENSQPRPVSRPPVSRREVERLEAVETLAAAAGVRPWELAGLMRAARWSPGKQVAEATFEDALNRFRKRPQGGGRI